MPKTRPKVPSHTTSLRLTSADRLVLDKLMKMTGQDSYASVIRLALRESVAARGKWAS